MSEMIAISVSSGFGGNTRLPYVQIVIEAADFMTQMPPDAAREVALNLLAAAEAAEMDGCMVRFAEDRMQIADDETLAIMLQSFRTYRDEFWKDGE